MKKEDLILLCEDALFNDYLDNKTKAKKLVNIFKKYKYLKENEK